MTLHDLLKAVKRMNEVAREKGYDPTDVRVVSVMYSGRVSQSGVEISDIGKAAEYRVYLRA